MARSIASAAASVAPAGVLPVLVFRKSAPASSASREALLDQRRVAAVRRIRGSPSALSPRRPGAPRAAGPAPQPRRRRAAHARAAPRRPPAHRPRRSASHVAQRGVDVGAAGRKVGHRGHRDRRRQLAARQRREARPDAHRGHRAEARPARAGTAARWRPRRRPSFRLVRSRQRSAMRAAWCAVSGIVHVGFRARSPARCRPAARRRARLRLRPGPACGHGSRSRRTGQPPGW